MKILSLDTTMAACSVAVVCMDHALLLAQAFVPMERGHGEALAPMAAEVMERSGVDFAAIGRIAVTTGPGTFTGLRIGLSFARGLGLARGIPVIGIDSLTAIAANEDSASPLLVASDARNGEVYAAAFDAERRILLPPQVTTLAGAGELAARNSLVIGTAKQAVIAASGRSDLSSSEAGDLPVAGRFARLAASAPGLGMPGPLYLRAPDAKPQATPLRKAGYLTLDRVAPEAATLLAELHAEAFDTAWSAKAFAELMEMPGATARIAREHDEPRGFIMTRQAADEAEIITIATRPGAQRRGIARRLLERELGELARQGVRQVFLEVAASNTAARELYRAMGFEDAGIRKAYYERPHGREDAIIMRRSISL